MHCILLSHVFIREDEHHKLDAVNFALQHWRTYNPEAYIIVTGHGLKPDIEAYCNHMYWPAQIIEEEINVGHPQLVNIGLEHASERGFKKILKSRADTIHSITNINSYCDNLLGIKKLLVTQQTSIHRTEMGDLFIYGDTDTMKKSFNLNNWHPTKTGLTKLAENFLAHCDEDTWHEACVKNLAFVDIYNIRWIDFRKNWSTLKERKKDMLHNNLVDEHLFYWGAMEKWHVWDRDGNMIFSKPKMGRITTEKDWK
mgnify:CR=1 FL=1